MITHENDSAGKAEVSNISNVSDMGMKVTAKSFSLLIDKLYSRKPCAVVRELGANARDAMQSAGRGDQPFEVHLPNSIAHEIIFKDNGTGLSPENVKKYMGTLFESNKETSNEMIGAYGLGCKSPFAVTDSYIIDSRFEGKEYHFTFFRSKGCVPQLVQIGESETAEGNGITFRVPAAPTMFNQYAKSVAAQLFFFQPRPVVYGSDGNQNDIWNGYGEVKMRTDKWAIVKSSGMREYYGKFIVNMGGINYPLSPHQLGDFNDEHDFAIAHQMDKPAFKELMIKALNGFTQYADSLPRDNVLVLFVGIGDIEVPPSREVIDYDVETCYNITVQALVAFKSISEVFVEELEAAVDSSSVTALIRSAGKFNDIIRWAQSPFDKNGEIVARGTSDYSTVSNAPDLLHAALQELQYEVPLAANFGGFSGRNGKAVTNTVTVGITSLRGLLDSLRVDAQHIQAKINREHIVYLDAENKFITPPPMDMSYNAYDEASGYVDYSATFSTNAQVPLRLVKHNINGQAANNLVEAQALGAQVKPFEKQNEQLTKLGITKATMTWVALEWQPNYSVSNNVIPESGIVNPQIKVYTPLENFSLMEAPTDDKRGLRMTFIMVDGDDISKKAAWIMRRMLGDHRYIIDDVECLNLQPHDLGRLHQVVRIVKSHDGNFDWFKENAPRIYGRQCSFYSLKETKIPKRPIEKKQNLNIRGVKQFLYNLRDYRPYGPYGFIDMTGENVEFSPIVNTDVDLPEGFLVFNNGTSERIYLDKEFKYEILPKQLGAIARSMSEMMMKNIRFYRLSPSNAKNIQSFEDAGLVSLRTILLQIGSKLDSPLLRDQFKRRYRHFLHKEALFQTCALGGDTFPMVKFSRIHGVRNRLTTKLKQVSFWVKDKEANKWFNERGMRSWFGARHAKLHSPLNIYEYARLMMDATLYADNNFLSRFMLEEGLNPDTKGIKHHMIKETKRYRVRFGAEHYKAILGSALIERDSPEFGAAITKTLAVLNKLEGFTQQAQSSIIP